MIAVTGASGFVGSILIAFLSKRNYQVKALGRKELSDLSINPGCSEVLMGCNYVVHLAARVHVMKDVEIDPLLAFRKVNVEGTLCLARNAKALGIKRFVFISSIKVNGEETFGRPFSVNDQPAPEDSYGISKLEAEIELMKLHERGVFEVIIIRPPLIYGVSVKANFKKLMILVSKRFPLPFGSVKNKRSLVSVLNLCDLITHCLSHPYAGGEVFLVSDDYDYSLPEIITKIGKVLKVKPLLLCIPVSFMRFGLVVLGKRSYSNRLFGNLHVDIEKTKRVLGWKPKYSFEDTFNY